MQLEFSSVRKYCINARHTLVFYLVVLIEHIFDWNIQTRLSGERPRIHGVRLSMAYSNSLYAGFYAITCERDSFTKIA